MVSNTSMLMTKLIFLQLKADLARTDWVSRTQHLRLPDIRPSQPILTSHSIMNIDTPVRISYDGAKQWLNHRCLVSSALQAIHTLDSLLGLRSDDSLRR